MNKGSLGCLGVQESDGATVIKTVTDEPEAAAQERHAKPEDTEFFEEVNGGAGRVRTAASQFCRLLP